MFVFTGLFLLSYIIPAFLIFTAKEKRSKLEIVHLFLFYQILINIGVLSFLSFGALMFAPEAVAKILDWPTCPFQHELGNVNLAFSVLGFLSIRNRGGFWTATALGAAIWLFGDGIGHIINAYTTGNYSEGNVGVPLYTDLAISLTLFALLAAEYRLTHERDKI